MHKIKIDKTDIKKARRWCRENFGDIPLKYAPFFANSRYGYMYDEKKLIWVNRLNIRPTSFYFKQEEDAMAFKLRWI